MFLTPKELRELTGWSRSAKQADWLAARAYRFDARADGSLAVLRAEVEGHLLSRRPTPEAKTAPDLAALG